MNPGEFQEQFNRLTSEWPNQYGKEKQSTLWHAFKTDHIDMLRYCITEAIKSSRYAPTIAMIEEQKPRYREMINAQSKRRYSQEAEEFMTSYSNEETKNMMEIIMKRINGKVSDKDYNDFKKDLENIHLESKARNAYGSKRNG